MDPTYTPGDTVPSSGIYEVTHDPGENKKPHEVIALRGGVVSCLPRMPTGS